jgi:hypothetical protein
MASVNDTEPIELTPCTRDEYAFLARYCGTVPESKSIFMSNGMLIGSRSNQYFYVSPIAYRVAAGRELSGKSTKRYAKGGPLV